METIDTSMPVMVTGASGYVAGWLVKKLLDAGHTVHAAIRDPANIAKRAHLDAIAANAPGELRYFQADLLDHGSYEQAMQGCGVVFHTASPFTTQVEDARRELVKPALDGTRNVLATVDRIGSVERVVLTSSCAAIYGDNIDCRRKTGQILTEDDWNTSSSVNHNPYQYSKTVAEREAWRMAGRQSRWTLVVLNPSLVLGPGLNPQASSESFAIVKHLGDGSMKAGVPKFGLATVDVRDLAEAHYRAGFSAAADGRHIVSATNTTLMGMVQALSDDYRARFPLPTRQVPALLAVALAPLAGQSWRFARRNFGHELNVDNRKSVNALGMRYRPLTDTMNEFFAQLIENGLVWPRKAYSLG